MEKKIRDKRCDDCFRLNIQKLKDKFPNTDFSPVDKRLEEMFENSHYTSPEIQQLLTEAYKQQIGQEDLYQAEKKISNRIGQALYDEWKIKIKQMTDPLTTAVRLSVAANILDYGSHHPINIDEAITKVLETEFAIDHSDLLFEKLKEARNILYLCDNTGEIYLDKLLIETVGIHQPVIAVRGGAVLNDALMEDAEEAGLHRLGKLISNGSNAPSTILSDCSPGFLEIYEQADLIIAKGMGNLEGLVYEPNPNIFFLLMAKCDVISDLLRVSKGSFVVAYSMELWN